MEKIRKYHPTIRCIYLCVLVAYTVLREIIPLQPIVGAGIVTAGVFGVGLLLIAANFFLDRDHPVKENIVLLLGFLFVCVISTLINFKYSFVENLKAIAWMSLYFFLLYPYGFHSKDRNNSKKEMAWITSVAHITLLFGVLLSIPMYFFDIDYAIAATDVIPADQGFNHYFKRLWGVFNDPNVIATYAFIVLLMSIHMAVQLKSILLKIWVGVSDVIIFAFIVLTGSRSAYIAMIITVAWATFSLIYHLLKIPRIKKVCMAVASAVLAVLCVVGMYSATKALLPQAKSLVKQTSDKQTVRVIHKFYDELYDKASIVIYVGRYQEEVELPDNGTVEGGGDLGGGQGNEDNSGNESLDRPDVENDGDLSNGRFVLWSEALQLFMKSPIFGVSPRGAKAFAEAYFPNNNFVVVDKGAHNCFIDVLMSTGIVGFAVVILVMLRAAISILRKTFKTSLSKTHVFFSSVILALLCASMLQNDLFFLLRFGGCIFWLAMGYINGEEEYVTEEELAERFDDGKQRILIYGPNDPVGGVEKIVYDYVKAITEKHPDVSFDFLQCGREFSMEKELTDLGCRVLYVPSRMKSYFKYKVAVEKIFADTRYTAVWGNYSGLTNIDLLVFAKKYGVPVRIAHSHNSRLSWGSPIMKYVVHTLHYYNKLWIADYTTDFWTCSAVAGEFMFPKSVHKDMRLIVNAVDVDSFAKNKELREKTREELGIEKDAFVVGNVARLCYQKNQEFLLNVMAELVKIQPSATLLLVGEGEYLDALQAQADSLGIKDSVRFLGLRADVPVLLQAMDVFVLTSRYEGLSVSAVEAQASGLPCVLPTTVSKDTDVSGLVRFLALEESYTVWAQALIEQGKTEVRDAKERIIENGYEIHSAAESLYSLFVS